MRFNPRLKGDIEKYKDYVIVVEGKKDKIALEALGFYRVHMLHQTGVPLKDCVSAIAQELDKKDKVCILTDLDKKGKELYMKIKPMFQEEGVKLDSSFRGLLLKSGISHIEGLNSFMEKIDRI